MFSQGTIFFVMLPMMFLLCRYLNFFTLIYLLVLKQELTVTNTIGVREKSRSTAIRKIDFLNVEFTFDFIP